MKSMKIGIGAASLLLAVAGCKTTTVTSIPGANVKHDQVTSAAPAQVDTWFWNWWFTNGKNITVSKDGYAQKSVRLSFSTPATINVNLDRKFNVSANEQGATVYVDGIAKGKTPLKGVAINDSGSSVVSVKKQGWLEAKMTPNPETPTDINLVMDQDGSGRRLLELIPTQSGVSIRSTPIFSPTEVGESSPNVSHVQHVTTSPQTEYIQDFSLLPDGKTMVVSILEEYMMDSKIRYRSNIWKMNTAVAGAPRAAVTTGNFHDITPNAAFDGSMLYFATTRNGKLSVCRPSIRRIPLTIRLRCIRTATIFFSRLFCLVRLIPHTSGRFLSRNADFPVSFAKVMRLSGAPTGKRFFLSRVVAIRIRQKSGCVTRTEAILPSCPWAMETLMILTPVGLSTERELFSLPTVVSSTASRIMISG